jgi:DNA-binding NarL/FixJ family response regulator
VLAAEQLSPDVIVSDISMPGLDGIAAATLILRRSPCARIVFVTVHCDPLLMERGFETGALGYVRKGAAGRGASERCPFGPARRTSRQ